jgi:hypothetical protein
VDWMRKAARPGLRLNIQQAAPDGDGDGVRPVVRSEFLDQILDVEGDRRLSNPQLARDLFVPMAIADQPEHIHLTRRQIFVPQVFGKPGRNLGGHMLSTGMDRPNHRENPIARHAFQQRRRRLAWPAESRRRLPTCSG